MKALGASNVGRAQGFTLVELLVATVLLMLLMLVTVSVLNAVATIDTRTRARVDTFREARAGFELMTRRISQAMLNTYWDYFDANNQSRNPTDLTFQAKSYGRQSELHFVSGPAKLGTTPLLPDAAIPSVTHGIFFQSPQGLTTSAAAASANLPNLLNNSGYFPEYTSDVLDRPKFLRAGTPRPPDRWRFRLTEFNQGSEYLQVYRATAAGSPLGPFGWFQQPLKSTSPEIRSTRVLAENVIALILLPHRSPNDPVPAGAPPQLAPNYFYDSRAYVTKPNDALALLSRNQLPPMVQVTMVVIDERSAQRLQELLGGTPGNMQTATNLLGLTTGATSGLFQKPASGAGEDKNQYLADLQTLTAKLTDLRLTYRVFSTDVSILQAKWSE